MNRPDLRVDRVDDPDGSTRIIRVSGSLSSENMPLVVAAWADVDAPHALHIDLHDASIADLSTMLAFERAIDHLERHDIGLRIVGVDPAHPALIR